MITAEAAGLALKLAKGAIKLAKQVDLVLAEKGAVETAIALPAPNLTLMPSKTAMKLGLTVLLAESPNPLTANERRSVETALNDDKLGPIADMVRQFLPELANSRFFDADNTFITALKQDRPDWAKDPELVITAFYAGPGRDMREKNYSWRLALTVVDVLAEFGAENTALFSRDERIQGVVGTVLKRFGEADLQKLDSTRDALRAVLAATLNGALDARESLLVENLWIDGLVDAIGKARDALPQADQDEFLIGIVRGKGYPLLVASLLEIAAKEINDDKVVDFRDVAADFLVQVAAIVKNKPEFEDFFEEHWCDLLRAGLSAVSSNAPALLGDKKLLGMILTRVADDLAKHSDSTELSTEALFGIVNSTAAVIAANPDLAPQILGANNDWVDKLLVSVAETVVNKGIRKVFSHAGIETIFKDAFKMFSKHPELLVDDSELAAALVGGVLKQLSSVKSFAAGDLADAAIGGALTALSENPALLDLNYPDLVSSFTGKIAKLVEDKSLTGIQAGELLRAGVASLAQNPKLFLDLQKSLAEETVDLVLRIAKGRPAMLVAGISLSRIGKETLSALARKGQAALDMASPGSQSLTDLIAMLERLLQAGLDRAEAELGHALSLANLPKTIGLLIEAWADGRVGTIDPAHATFIALFNELAVRAAA